MNDSTKDVTINNPAKKANSIMTWTQQDGKLVCTVAGAGEVSFDPDKVSAVNRARFMLHGMKQRAADGAALLRDPETGLSATPEEKLASVRRIVEHYEAGGDDWNLRTAEPKTEGDGTWLAKALVHLGKAATIEAATALILKFANAKHGGQLGPARKALMAASDIAKAVLDLKAAAVAANSKTNSDDLLGELDAAPIEQAPF